MAAYVGKRLLLLIPTLLGVSVLTFLLIHLIPGDLVTILLGITAGQNEQTRPRGPAGVADPPRGSA